MTRLRAPDLWPPVRRPATRDIHPLTGSFGLEHALLTSRSS